MDLGQVKCSGWPYGLGLSSVLRWGSEAVRPCWTRPGCCDAEAPRPGCRAATARSSGARSCPLTGGSSPLQRSARVGGADRTLDLVGGYRHGERTEGGSVSITSSALEGDDRSRLTSVPCCRMPRSVGASACVTDRHTYHAVALRALLLRSLTPRRGSRDDL